MTEPKKKTTRQSVRRQMDVGFTTALEDYFTALDGETPAGLYAMVIESAERALIEFVMKRTHNNQSLAARMLGISRTTLRDRLVAYKLG